MYESYVSSRNDLFKLYKKNDVLLRLHDSGLVGFLADKFVPEAIVLFCFERGGCGRQRHGSACDCEGEEG